MTVSSGALKGGLLICGLVALAFLAPAICAAIPGLGAVGAAIAGVTSTGVGLGGMSALQTAAIVGGGATVVGGLATYQEDHAELELQKRRARGGEHQK